MENKPKELKPYKCNNIDCDHIFYNYKSFKKKCPKCKLINTISIGTYKHYFKTYDRYELKDKIKGKKKPILEVIEGFAYYLKKQKFILKKRVIDRKNDRYFEEIKDPDSDEIIHKCDEKLSEHYGHGSAKKKI